ncbi:hypothetical protein [Saccharothrix sp.]|uniref:hypothetical protein n=1 Tax=Saccharothrix sp. TaxID=1873460 RepID=UPI002811865D|nr:hypothetical protein [Saccharothrix sp.]
MSAVPAPVLLLMAGLAVAGLIVLWKVLLTAGLIGLTQWVVITQTDSPTAALIVFGLPALALALVLRRSIPPHRFPRRPAGPRLRPTREGVVR